MGLYMGLIDLLSYDIVFPPRLGHYNAVLCATSRFSMKLHYLMNFEVSFSNSSCPQMLKTKSLVVKSLNISVTARS